MDRSEEIDRNITKKYEVFQKLGKGVSIFLSQDTFAFVLAFLN